MIKKRSQNQHLASQKGIVLVITLLMLVLLTIIGIAGMNVTNLEEKMAGNSKDKNLAFQAAEAALRDAENDIQNSGRLSGLTEMDSVCTNGLCFKDANGIPNIENDNAKVANAVEYGAYTSVKKIDGLASQPKYLIVGRRVKKSGAAAGFVDFYEITSFSTGASNNTQVILREVYVP